MKKIYCENRYCGSQDAHCNDQRQGHLITFYPWNWFNSKYDWGDNHCVVQAYNLNWNHIDDGSAIEDSEHFYSNTGNRDWLSRCKDYKCADNGADPWVSSGQWEPWVCWDHVDGDDRCKWINEWETKNVGKSTSAEAAAAAAVVTTIAAAATTTTAVGVTDKGRVGEYSLYVVLVSLTISILVKYAKEGKRSEGYAVLVDVQ